MGRKEKGNIMFNHYLKNYKSLKPGAILLLAAVFFILGPTWAAEAQNSGGFSGPGPELTTVQEAQKMRDDSRVSLKGNLVKSLGDEVYLFRDATGTIEVEIDGDIWRGQNIKPEDIVVISGELDKEWNHTSIDVSSISKQ